VVATGKGEILNDRAYQYDYSTLMPSVYDRQLRERKARTILAVLQDHFGERLSDFSVLDIGCSSGIIADVLATQCASVHGTYHLYPQHAYTNAPPVAEEPIETVAYNGAPGT